MKFFYSIIFALAALQLFGQVNVVVDASATATPVSPYIYGRNNSLSGNPGSGFTPEWTKLKDAGVQFFREGGGNNSTKYNWRRKLSSHPDWYNNVYANDWTFAVQSLQQNIPTAQGMWSFQLIGKAAKTSTANFNDWGYNGSQWWSGVNQNLAGGGVVNPSGGVRAATEGNPNLYLENWTADSTTAILTEWFDRRQLDKTHLRFWSMDNEPEIWNGTHDDVMPTQLSAEDFMQRYFEVAKKARAKYPDIKLVGPVPANEWQWYNWSGGITQGGRRYAWLEYFIKRVAEEQQASGVRLLDVLDIHFYPGSSRAEEIVQFHRVFFDRNYVFPEANGVKNVTGNWDASQNKEYIFERCKDWLNQHMGAGHGVTFGLSEVGVTFVNSSTSAVWYASTLGEFMKHPEVEIFSPWTWQTGMWEVLHLYSRYNKKGFVPATSSEETLVSAYPTINAAGDSLTLVLVNRATASTKTANVSINGFTLSGGPFQQMRLANLPGTETFVSHTSNALQKTTISASGNSLSVSLPAMSVTTILLKGTKGEVVTAIDREEDREAFRIFPNPVASPGKLHVEIAAHGYATLKMMDLGGKEIKTILNQPLPHDGYHDTVDLNGLASGVYILQLSLNGRTLHRKVVVGL